MTLQQRIESAMRESMRAGDRRRTSTLRLAMAAAHNRQIELGHALTDDEVIEVLSRQVKQRRESIEQFRAGNREEMARAEEEEAAILTEFLPEQLSTADLERIVAEAIAATGASTPADMGKVMGRVVQQTRGRADGKAVSDLVRGKLGA